VDARKVSIIVPAEQFTVRSERFFKLAKFVE